MYITFCKGHVKEIKCEKFVSVVKKIFSNRCTSKKKKKKKYNIYLKYAHPK